MKNTEEKEIKVLLGNVGVEFSKDGIFATLRAVQVNPQENIVLQIEKYIENDSTLRGLGYEWVIKGEIHKYYADMKASEKSIRQLRDQGYIVEECVKAETSSSNTVELLINDYIGDNYTFSRQTKFVISQECLQDYLTATEDGRNVTEFLDTYDSDESETVYNFAVDDGRVLSEDITYCNDFMDKYNAYRKQAIVSNLSDEEISKLMTKEDFYWNVYVQ